MIPQIRQTELTPPTAGKISVEPRFQAALQTDLTKQDIQKLFYSFRLDLQGRLASLETDQEMYQLQGKLIYNEELEKFFLELLKISS